MDEAKREVLDLLQDRLKRSLARKWNEHDASSELTANEAREKVTELFRDQLTDGIGAKDPGGNAFAGLLSLQTAFPSLPRPPSDDEILHAIERSKADYYAFQALRILAHLQIAPRSAALKTWEQNALLGLICEPPFPKGPSPFRDAHRNMLIISQIEQLEHAGFKPTRNKQQNVDSEAHESGCDIVADSLSSLGQGMSYAAVERVWKNREKQPRLDILATLITHAILSIASDPSSSEK